jgi:translation elongation factor IF5A
MSTSKTGKHGHAKVHLVATDIFTQKKLEELSPSTHNMDVPHVRKNEYSLLDIDEGFLSLMQEDGSTKDDVKVPDTDLGKKIEEDFEAGKDLLIAVTSAMGEEHVLGVNYISNSSTRKLQSRSIPFLMTFNKKITYNLLSRIQHLRHVQTVNSS